MAAWHVVGNPTHLATWANATMDPQVIAMGSR